MKFKLSRLVVSIIILVGFCTTNSHAQTQEEIDQVTLKLGRPQTRTSTCSFLAGAYKRSGKFDKAISYYKLMLKVYADDPALGPTSPKYGWVLTEIALCEKQLGHADNAAKLCNQARTIVANRNPQNDRFDSDYLKKIEENSSSVLGNTVPLPESRTPAVELQGISRSEVPDLHKREAEAVAAVKTTKQMGITDPRYLKELLYLANIYTLERKFSKAQSAFEDVIKAVETRFGKHDKMLLTPLSNYGYMLKAQGQVKEAEAILERMKQIAGPN